MEFVLTYIFLFWFLSLISEILQLIKIFVIKKIAPGKESVNTFLH